MTPLKLQLRSGLLAFLALFLWATARAQITPLGDAYTNTATPTGNFGAKTLLDVDGATQITYIQFNLASIPATASISQATLKLYVNSVVTAGSFNVDYVNGSWTEGTIDANNAPPLGAAIASNVNVTTAEKNQYILVNITPAVQAWLNGSQANDGLALVANSSFNATFDSKESTTTSHPPELDVAFAGGDGTITGVTTASGSGLQGGGTSGTLNLSLTTACAANQVLQWTGSAWGCASAGTGTITGVKAGADLTGGGSSGNVTLNLDTTKVPQLAANNIFTGNQTVNGSLSATGVVIAAGYQVGGNLFDFGSYANGNAFLGFGGNTAMTGTNNTAVGVSALLNNTTGSYNTSTGVNVLYSNTTGDYNTASGIYALSSNTGGNFNTATGSAALSANTTGDYNTATGGLALQLNTTGYNNTATGGYALNANTAGAYNTATGYDTLLANTTGAENTADGAGALYQNTTGNYNTASGYNALTTNSTASYNTAVGYGALSSNQTGRYLTCIGYECGVSADGLTNATAIGANAFVGKSNALVLGGTGSFAVFVGIGTTTPGHVFEVAQGAGIATADAWDTYSSRRWKTNIQTLQGALAKVEQLRGVSYDLKESGKHEVGVIAEEVGAVVPEVVSWEKNGKDAQGVDYGRLTALLIEAAKEQQALIHKQQKQIRMQQAQMKAQQAQIARLGSQVNAIQASLKTTGRGSEVRTTNAQVAMVHQ